MAWCIHTQMLPVVQTVTSSGAFPNYEAFRATQDMRGKLLD